MRFRSFALFCSVAALAATAAAYQESSRQEGEKKPEPVKIVGCVAPDSSNANHFTLADLSTGSVAYRLSGKDVRQYVGKRVEITGVEPKVKIIGGLGPSPNVAAQAGAIDPTQAAMAQQGSQGNTKPGNILVPELRVTAVKGVAGGCNPR
jgi:hypothetical protein